MLAGVGYFGEIRADGATAARGDGSSSSSSSSTSRDAEVMPPPIPPSHAAAKAATAALKAQLCEFGASSNAKLDAVVRDSSGALAAAAAEVTCWEATDLPPALATLLKEHATGHISSHSAG